MISRAGPLIYWTTSALLPSSNPKPSSSLPRQRKFASIRLNFSVSSNQRFDSPSSPKKLLLNCAAKCSEPRTESWIVGDSGPLSSIRFPSMPAAIGSASIYPIKGLFFFLRKENRILLLKRVVSFVAEVGAASAAILGSLVGFTFSAQKALVLTFMPPPLIIPGTIVLLLIETAIPVGLVFYQRLHRVQEKLFVDVLHMQNVHVAITPPEEREWIGEQRGLQLREQGSRRRSIFKGLTDPSALNKHPVTKYFVTLPLNFVPVVGQAAFCWLNAMDTAGVLHHHYYSSLKGLSSDEEATIIYIRRKQYQQFGVMASALTLIPGLNVLLVLTNSVGAALWAADIEKAMQKRS